MSCDPSFVATLRVWGLLGSLLTVLLFGWFFVAGLKSLNRRNQDQSDSVPDRPDMPYRVFTKAFDEVVRARDLGRILSVNRNDPYPQGIKVPDWHKRIKLAEVALSDAEARFGKVRLGEPADDSVAIVILVDQSGSNKDRMPMVAGALQYTSRILQERGCKHAILGFTTSGWCGGSAFQAWKGAGKKPYPGRLCALRHIVYKDFDEVSLDREDWITLCHPGALHENVDGEALEWASAQLRSRSEHKKLLIHVSDGVPMDDATAAHNGVDYLNRHCHIVIERLKSEGLISLASLHVVDTDEEILSGFKRTSPELLPTAIFAAVGIEVLLRNATTSYSE